MRCLDAAPIRTRHIYHHYHRRAVDESLYSCPVPIVVVAAAVAAAAVAVGMVAPEETRVKKHAINDKRLCNRRER